MKKLFSLLTVVTIVFCCSVPAFAATDLNVLLPDLFLQDDANSVVGIINYNKIDSEEGKIFYKEVLNAVSGGSYDTNYCYFIVVNGQSDAKDFVFLRIPSIAKLDTKSNALALDKPSLSVKRLHFNYYKKATNSDLFNVGFFSDVVSSTLGPPYSISVLSPITSTSAICILASSPNASTQVLNSANYPNFFNNTYKGNLIFRDNNPEQPIPPPEPETPVAPSKPPDIPQGDPNFVPYDTSVWQKFLKYVNSNIGSSVNIGLLIFAVVFGIGLVVSIVRHFSKRG